MDGLGYLCGYFLADGYAEFSKTGRGKIRSETKDLELAENLKSEFGATFRRRIRTLSTGVTCEIYSIIFPSSVSIAVRSMQSTYKNFVDAFMHSDDNFQHSFMLGLLDGDGSICYYSKSNKCRVLFYSAEPEVSEIIEYYLRKNNVKYSKSVDSRGHSVTQYSIGNKLGIVTLFRNWHNLGRIFLTRKWRILYDSVRSLVWYKVITPSLEVYTVDRKEVENLTGLSQSSISDRISGRFQGLNGITVCKVPFLDYCL